MSWKRPVDVPAQTWRQFRGRERDGRPALKYEIRDAEEKDRDICVDFLTATFLRDEPLCQALAAVVTGRLKWRVRSIIGRLCDVAETSGIKGILSDPDSVTTIQANWRGFLEQGVSLACHASDGSQSELVGFAICLVSCIYDDREEVDFDQIKGEPWKRLLRTLQAADRAYDVYKRCSDVKFFSIHVMAVAPEHRGMNIGVELFKASEALARALDLKYISAIFTAVQSQRLAAKCGFNLLAELPYSTMLDHGIDLSSCSADSAHVMGKEL